MSYAAVSLLMATNGHTQFLGFPSSACACGPSPGAGGDRPIPVGLGPSTCGRRVRALAGRLSFPELDSGDIHPEAG